MIGILTKFFKSSKRSLPLLILFCLTFCSFYLEGCLYQLALEKPQGAYSSLNLKYALLALAPIPDASGFPESGRTLSQSLHDLLKEKGFSLIWTQDWALPSASSPPALGANKLPEKLGTNFLLTGSILEYTQESSVIGSAGFPSWQGTHDEYIFLPTYRQGYLQIKIILILWDLEKKSILWKKEGKISGPTFASKMLMRKLLRHLCVDFPL